MTDASQKSTLSINPSLINCNDTFQDKMAASQPTLAAHFLGQHSVHDPKACMVEPFPRGPLWPGVPRDIVPHAPFDPIVPFGPTPRKPLQDFLIPRHGVSARPQDAALVAKVGGFVRDISKNTTGQKRTHFILVLDQSTSMLTGKEMTIAGFNQQVQIIRRNAKDAGLVTVTLVIFDTQVKPIYVGMPVESLQELDASTYLPSGGTAMYDAVGSVLEIAMALPDAKDPSTAFFISVLTDGDDLDSKHVTGKAVGEGVKQLTETGRFTFALMGPKEHLNNLAAVLSLNKGNVEGFDPSSMKSRGESIGAMAGATQSYMATRSMGVMASASLYSPADGKL